MAELTPFSFRPGKTLLHSFDVRFKLILVVMISLSMANAAVSALSAVTALFILLSFHTRMSIAGAVKELRYFLFLLLLVFFARLFSTSGEPLFNFYFITLTKNGVHEGALVCWRLLLVVYLDFADQVGNAMVLIAHTFYARKKNRHHDGLDRSFYPGDFSKNTRSI
jgi:energy-coupling factor transport system permease protein